MSRRPFLAPASIRRNGRSLEMRVRFWERNGSGHVPADAVRRGQGSNRWNYDLGIDRLPAALYRRWRCSGRRGRKFKAPALAGRGYAR